MERIFPEEYKLYWKSNKYGLSSDEMRAVLSAVNWLLIAYAENKEMTEIYTRIREKIMMGLGIADD